MESLEVVIHPLQALGLILIILDKSQVGKSCPRKEYEYQKRCKLPENEPLDGKNDISKPKEGPLNLRQRKNC